MSRILVTGSSGFIASALIPQLLAAGHEVHGTDNDSKYGATVRRCEYHPRSHYDLTRPDRIDQLFSINDPNYIIHTASVIGGIHFFHREAARIIQDNLAIDANVIRAASRLPNLRRFIGISSSMIYEQAGMVGNIPSSEAFIDSMPPPKSAYGFSKLALIRLLEASGLPYSIAVPFNAVGPGEYGPDSHVLPDLIRKALACTGDDPLVILGRGNQTRNFTHVDDLARGLITLMDHPKAFGEIFNLSTTTPTTVAELASMVWDRIHPGKPLRLVPAPSYPHDVITRSPDTRKARELLGFTADTPLSVAIDQVIQELKKA